MIDRVTLEQLRALRAVAREGSFSSAARRLGRAQSGLSQAVERLERELGLRLFDRSGKTARLTPSGRAVLDAAERVCEDFEELGALVGDLRDRTETELSIVLDALFPVSALSAFARDFAREHPRVALTIRTETLRAVTACVRERKADFGVAGPAADFDGLRRKHLAEVRLVPVCAAAHPLASHRGALPSRAVAEHVQIVLSERAFEGGAPTSDQAVLSPRTWRVVDLATKHALIRDALGWGNLPEHLIQADLAARALVRLDIEGWGPDEHLLSLSLVTRAGGASRPVRRWAEARIGALCRSEIDQERP